MKNHDTSKIKLLREGTYDSKILLILWYTKRTFWPLILLGSIGGLLASDLNNEELDFSNPESVISKLLSPLASLAVALFIKVAVDMFAAISAYPIVHERIKDFQNPKYGYIFTRYLDMWQIIKGVRTLRWTHQVRQEALQRVGNDLIKNGKLDKFFDLLTIVLIIMLTLTPVILGF